jgi:hypothetical protein
MSTANTGPPGKERPGDHHDAEPNQTTVSRHHHRQSNLTVQPGETLGNGLLRQLRARRAASYRLPVLESGRSDPSWHEPPGARGYEDAAMHLLEAGLLPAADREGLQLMHRRGCVCRKAAEFITERWGWRHDR